MRGPPLLATRAQVLWASVCPDSCGKGRVGSQGLGVGLPGRDCCLCWDVVEELDPRCCQAPAVPGLCQLTQRTWEVGGMEDRGLVSLRTGKDIGYRVAGPLLTQGWGPAPLTPSPPGEGHTWPRTLPDGI